MQSKNQTTDFKNYLFRAHSVGRLAVGLNPGLTDKQEIETARLLDKQDAGNITPKQTITLGQFIAKRDAKPELSKGVKTFLEELWAEEVFNRREKIEGKKLEKGTVVESISFSLFTRVSKENVLFLKNAKQFKNSFFRGTPDNAQIKVRDIKSSWELKTFKMFDKEITNSLYKWQLQIYMDLVGLDKAQLIYCLVDTPFNLIDDKINSLNYKYDFSDSNGDLTEDGQALAVETINRMVYTWDGLKAYCDRPNAKYTIKLEWFEEQFKEIPEKARVTIIEIERNEDDVKAMKAQIILARKFMNGLSLDLAEKIA